VEADFHTALMDCLSNRGQVYSCWACLGNSLPDRKDGVDQWQLG